MNKLAIDGGDPIFNKALGYGHQLIEDDDVAAVEAVLRSDYLTCRPATEAFERDLAAVTGAKYVTAVSNGMAALHVACLAAGVRPGDEVIVSSITFAASANCALYCGAKPVFADIDPETWEIDVADIECKITPRTKAVVAVDFGGCTPDVAAIRRICDERGLVYIEDAAHSIGIAASSLVIGTARSVVGQGYYRSVSSPPRTVVAVALICSLCFLNGAMAESWALRAGICGGALVFACALYRHEVSTVLGCAGAALPRLKVGR